MVGVHEKRSKQGVRLRLDYRQRRLLIAVKDGQVARYCRERGISRTTYYKWKSRYEAAKDKFEAFKAIRVKRRSGGRPKRIKNELARRLKDLAKTNPTWGTGRIHGQLQIEGINLSISAVYRFLKSVGMLKRTRVSKLRKPLPRRVGRRTASDVSR